MRPAAITKYLFLTVAIRIFVTRGRYHPIIEAIGVWAGGSFLAFYYCKSQVKTGGLSKFVTIVFLKSQS